MNRRTRPTRAHGIAPVETVPGIDWYDLLDLGLEGQGWAGPWESPYHRLPARAQALVSEPLWQKSILASGLRARWVTDSPSIQVQWTLRHPQRREHMAGTGYLGVDLYLRVGRRWRFAGVARPTPRETTTATILPEPRASEPTEYLLHLPLYGEVVSVRIGVKAGAKVAAARRWPAAVKPICFYGSSITQGGCASRPGMSYPAILGRLLDRPFLNLGFDGKALMEEEIGGLLAELDPSVYVLDPVGNMKVELIGERVEPFVRRLRQTRPVTPLVMMEQPMAGAAPTFERDDAFRAAYERLRNAGVTGLHYVSSRGFLGDDGEGTVDGIHPTDLGFLRIAEALAPKLKRFP